MSVLNQLASALGRRDEIPNIELARAIVEKNDLEEIAEIAAHLQNRDNAIASDCIKVLYEAAALKPELVAPFTDELVDLLTSKDNRLVWGAMTALAEVASLRTTDIWQRIEIVLQALRAGSVITVDRGVKVLALLSAASPDYAAVSFPEILHILDQTPPKGLAFRAEAALLAMPGLDASLKTAFLDLLERRATELTPSQFSKVNRVIQKIHAFLKVDD
jgi:hypothetical protein